MNYTAAELKTSDPNDWYIYYSYRHPETGFLKPFKVRGNLNRIKIAKERKRIGLIMASEYNVMLQGGWSPFYVAPAPVVDPLTLMPVKDLIPELLKSNLGSLRDDTARTYRSIQNIFKEFLQQANIADITASDFTEAKAKNYAEYLINIRKHSSVTFNNHVTCMHVFFQLIKNKKITSSNVFDEVKKKRTDEGSLMWFDKLKRDKIKQNLKNDPLKIYIQIIYYCFIRPSEIMHLKVRMIDFENAQINIPGYASKNRHNAIVPVKDELLKQLKEAYGDQDPDKYIFSNGLVPGVKKWRRDRVTTLHRKMLDKINVPGKLYDWKNTGARDFILSGQNPYALMAMMRHSSLEETMKYLRSLGITTGMKTDPKAWTF